MKTIDCSKRINKKIGVDELFKTHFGKTMNNAVNNKTFMDDNLSVPGFIIANDMNTSRLESFLYKDVNISISCAFVEPTSLRFSVKFEYKTTKKLKIVKIIRDFMSAAESFFSYLDKNSMTTDKNVYYFKMYKDFKSRTELDHFMNKLNENKKHLPKLQDSKNDMPANKADPMAGEFALIKD